MPDTPLPPLLVPDDLHYLVAHQVWARVTPNRQEAVVGITELGIQLSGEIFMCRPRRTGLAVAQGGSVAVVELAKAIVAVKSPVTGIVVEGNAALKKRPQLVHQDPYGEGWVARLALQDFAADAPQLLNGAAARAAMTEHAKTHADALVPDMLARRKREDR